MVGNLGLNVSLKRIILALMGRQVHVSRGLKRLDLADVIVDIPIGHSNQWLDAQFPLPVHFIWDIDPASSNHGGSDAESGWTTDEPDSDQSDSDESFSSLPDLVLA